MAPRTWVIDAANVVGARPDGWWRDRPGAAARLHARVARLLATPAWPAGPAGQDTPPSRVVLVLEGAARAGVEPTGNPSTHGTPVGGAASRADEKATLPGETPVAAGAATTPTLDVVHAPAAGDDAIVAAARAAAPPVLVFTSDRALRTRLAEAGAQARGAGALWALLDAT